MRQPLVRNPPWVTEILAKYHSDILDRIPTHPQWLPMIQDVRPGWHNKVSGVIREYGCGSYGCVLPTYDPKIVLKVTTDSTEAEFAADYANELVAPICVRYPAVMALGEQYRERDVFLLWRESAEQVGKLLDAMFNDENASNWETAEMLVNEQHAAAQKAYELLVSPGATAVARQNAVEMWVLACEAMTLVPEIRPLADGLLRVYREQRIFFGDIHLGNIGLVTSGTEPPMWKITDPGHIAVIKKF